jgi:hypothetical protein
MSGDNFANVATASGSPAVTPACRAIMMARAGVVSGMVAIEVMSPARPRSSSSARCTASSMASGDRKASGFSSEAGVVTMVIFIFSFRRPCEGRDPYAVLLPGRRFC